MNRVTAAWSMLMGRGVLPLPHLFTAIRQRRAMHWIFLAAIAGIAGMPTAELAMMHTQSAEQFSKGPEVFHFQWKMASDTQGTGGSSESAIEENS
jgi:hypothetical protein